MHAVVVPAKGDGSIAPGIEGWGADLGGTGPRPRPAALRAGPEPRPPCDRGDAPPACICLGLRHRR